MFKVRGVADVVLAHGASPEESEGNKSTGLAALAAPSPRWSDIERLATCGEILTVESRGRRAAGALEPLNSIVTIATGRHGHYIAPSWAFSGCAGSHGARRAGISF